MSTPLLVALVIALVGLVMLGREAQRFLKDDFHYASNPREARRSVIAGAAIGLVLVAVAGGLIGLIAGLSRYLPLVEGPMPAVTVSVEPHRSGGWLMTFPGHPSNVTMNPLQVDGEWFSIVADKIEWSGPLRWTGLRDSVRPCALMAVEDRDDFDDRSKIRRLPISADNLFERLAAGPLSSVGLCSLTEIRTPWRPLKRGAQAYLFNVGGGAAIPGNPGDESTAPAEAEEATSAPR